jgi:hypothetical protein
MIKFGSKVYIVAASEAGEITLRANGKLTASYSGKSDEPLEFENSDGEHIVPARNIFYVRKVR